jgi:hypothetical protein
MIGAVYEFSDLQRLSGYERRADVERWAERNGIALKTCRGGVWTTVDALNQALGLTPPGSDADPYGPDVV